MVEEPFQDPCPQPGSFCTRTDCPSPPPGPGHYLGQMDWTPGMRGEAGASLPGSHSIQDSRLDRTRTPEDAYLLYTRTRIRALRIALGPGLELPGLHLDSPPESSRTREGFARQQRSQELVVQQGDQTKLSLSVRLRELPRVCRLTWRGLSGPSDSSRPVYPPIDQGLPVASL